MSTGGGLASIGSGQLDEDVRPRDPHRVHRDGEIGCDVASAGTDVEIESVPGTHDAVPEEGAVGERSALVRTRAGQGQIPVAPGVEDGDRNAVNLDRLAPADGDLPDRRDTNQARHDLIITA
jgi:hypothetical protein